MSLKGFESLWIKSISEIIKLCRYIERLSKKPFFGFFPNFAYNKIRHLEMLKTSF